MKEYLNLLIIRTIGNFLVLLSLLIIGKTFIPVVYQEANYAFRQYKKTQTKVVLLSEITLTPTPALKANPFASLLQKINSREEIIHPANTSFSLVIPKIGANSPVIINVDSGNYEEYIEALKKGVAHAKGTALPGDKGHIYLFAHSTDTIFNINTYNAVFYLLSKLENNDEIIIYYRNKKYLYKVIGQKIVSPEEVDYLTRTASEEFLTLQTCWPPGTTLQRLLVFAAPVVK